MIFVQDEEQISPLDVTGEWVMVGGITFHDDFESYPGGGFPLDAISPPDEYVARENYTGIKAHDNHGTESLGGIATLDNSNTGTGWTDSYAARENNTGHVYKDSFQLYADATNLDGQGANGEIDWTAKPFVARSL